MGIIISNDRFIFYLKYSFTACLSSFFWWVLADFVALMACLSRILKVVLMRANVAANNDRFVK